MTIALASTQMVVNDVERSGKANVVTKARAYELLTSKSGGCVSV